MPLSTIAYATLERSTADKLPLITINHGRTDSTDGRVFPYVFPLQLNPYSEVSAIVNYIGQRSGGLDKLKGKKIGYIHLDASFGKEPIPLLEQLSKDLGFELKMYPVGAQDMQNQSSQWLSVRRDLTVPGLCHAGRGNGDPGWHRGEGCRPADAVVDFAP